MKTRKHTAIALTLLILLTMLFTSQNSTQEFHNLNYDYSIQVVEDSPYDPLEKL